MSNESFADKLKKKAQQDPLFREVDRETPEQRMARIERENMRLKEENKNLSNQNRNSIPQEATGGEGLAGKLAARRARAKVSDGNGNPLLDVIIDATTFGSDASGPSGPASFGGTKKE